MFDMEELREPTEAMSREVARLAPGAAGGDGQKLGEVWGRLLGVLALGPAPELRACPHCGKIGMRAATRCGSCWVKLTPPAASASAEG